MKECGDCMFYSTIVDDDDEGVGSIGYGECRRYPPVFFVENKALSECYGTEEQTAFSPRQFTQPVTSADGWCGEWKTP